MYLSIGGRVIRKKEIIGIFDLDTATVARQTKLFLRDKQNEGKLETAGEDIPRSFLLCEEKVLLCETNAGTLRARAERSPGKK